MRTSYPESETNWVRVLDIVHELSHSPSNREPKYCNELEIVQREQLRRSHASTEAIAAAAVLDEATNARSPKKKIENLFLPFVMILCIGKWGRRRCEHGSRRNRCARHGRGIKSRSEICAKYKLFSIVVVCVVICVSSHPFRLVVPSVVVDRWKPVADSDGLSDEQLVRSKRPNERQRHRFSRRRPLTVPVRYQPLHRPGEIAPISFCRNILEVTRVFVEPLSEDLLGYGGLRRSICARKPTQPFEP